MPDVVLIRPGCTEFDEQHRIQGSLDLPLSRRGHEQVELVLRQLRGVRLDVVYSAACEPARSTAIAICEECGATFKESPDFRNLNHGLWQGLQVDDVRRKFPKVLKQWRECPESVCLPEGETVAQAVERIQHGLRKCLKRKRNVAIVASEPLATLIGCVLRGARPELPDGDAYCQPERRIEFLHVSEDEGKRSVIASPSAFAGDKNGNATRHHRGRNGGAGNGALGNAAGVEDAAITAEKGATENGAAEKGAAEKGAGEKGAGEKGAAKDDGQSGRRNGTDPKAGKPADLASAKAPAKAPRRASE